MSLISNRENNVKGRNEHIKIDLSFLKYYYYYYYVMSFYSGGSVGSVLGHRKMKGVRMKSGLVLVVAVEVQNGSTSLVYNSG